MARLACFWAVACALQRVQAFGVAGHFPNYDDPVTGEAPLPHPVASHGRPCEVVDAVVGAAGRGRVVLGTYRPPSISRCGSAPWSQVVLQFSGAVAGLQFDRFGALYFRGVELLRLTTPEPSPAGITWRVDRDVTDYASLFEAPGDVQLDIQNYVNSKYTGVFELNVSFAFYTGGSRPRAPRAIVPLRNVTSHVRPLESTQTRRGGQVNWVKLPSDTVEARLDLYASAHGCEEFWYSNVMGDATEGCGGGAYRELDVYVDGVLAGAQHPFPVLYTGGMNPLLWRPLTGILSFDMPPYAFDLTPFLGWFVDGEEHNVTLDVVGQNKNGYWFLNGVFAIRTDGRPVQGGRVEVLNNKSLDFSEALKDHKQSSGQLQETSASREYHVRGHLVLASGEKVASEVSGRLSAQTTNRFEGEETLITNGFWNATRESIYNGTRRTEVTEYPLQLLDTYVEAKDSLQIEASIKFARNLAVTYARQAAADSRNSTPSSESYTVVLRNEMDNLAVYNRTLRDHTVNLKTALGSASFRVGADAFGNATSARHTPCYNRRLSASDGAIMEDAGKDACSWPAGVYVCGSGLCGDFLPGAASSAFGPGEALRPRSEQPSQWEEGVVRAFARARAELPLRSPARLGKRDATHGDGSGGAKSGTQIVAAVGSAAATTLDASATKKPKQSVEPARPLAAQLWGSAPHAELRGIAVDASQRSAVAGRGAIAVVVSASLFGVTLAAVAALGLRRRQWGGVTAPHGHQLIDSCEPDLLE